MLIRPAIRLPALFAALAMLLVMQWTGAHLHLCLDGVEPPMRVHLDDGLAHHAGDEGRHDDLDLNLPGAVLAKPDHVLPGDLLPLLAVCAVLLGWRGAVRIAPARAAPAPRARRTHLRPPLRGPPHTSR